MNKENNSSKAALKIRRSTAASAAGVLAAIGLASGVTTTPAAAIQGGSSASDMAKSVVRITKNDKQHCTGTVVGDGWILTAQHCTDGYDWRSLKVELTQDGVVANSAKWVSGLAQAAFVPAGGFRHTYIGKNGSMGYNDVALLQTASAMPSWAKTVPMALSWPGLGTALTAYGYGLTSGTAKESAPKLQKTPDGDIKRVDCGSLFSGSSGFSTGLLCTKGASSQVWGGDSGGPLLWWVNGYWQLVGDHMAISDLRPSVQHGQVHWSEADGTTRSWIRSYVTGAISANTIVRDPSNGMSWLYSSDGYRHYIGDTTTYNCLVSKGTPVYNWALRRIETLPDMVGNWASASCTTTPPPPPPAASPTISLQRGAVAQYGYWYNVYLSNFTPGSVVTLTCRDSVDPQGFWTQTFTIDGAGHAGDTTLCYSGDHPDHWVTSNTGVTSNVLTW